MERRLGVIGRRGQAGLWARAAESAPGWQLGTCFHPRPNHRLAPYPQTDSWASFTRASDAVVIASPTSSHLGYLRRLARGYTGPVLVEKPVVSSLRECRELLNLPAGFLKRVYVTQNWRFYPWVAALREILWRERGHPVLSADFHLTHDFGLKRAYASSWRSDRRKHPIGPAETQGIHWVDLAHHLFGPVEWISGEARRIGRVGSAPDSASIFLRMKSGVHCSIHTSYVAPVATYARILTSRCILTYSDGALQLQRQPPPKNGRWSQPAPRRLVLRVRLEALQLQPMLRQLEELGSVLGRRTKRSALIHVREGMANVVALEGFVRSIRMGQRFAMNALPLYAQLIASRP